MKRERHNLFILSLLLFFGMACVYSSFDVLVEADFLSVKKYEARDIEEVYADKQSNPEAVLVSPSLFTPLLGILFESLVINPYLNLLSAQAFSILRC